MTPTEALRLIAGDRCENDTSGPGACWSDPSRTPTAKYGADRVCNPCIAWAALLDARNRATFTAPRPSAVENPIEYTERLARAVEDHVNRVVSLRLGG